jgi:hypothetical protein
LNIAIAVISQRFIKPILFFGLMVDVKGGVLNENPANP